MNVHFSDDERLFYDSVYEFADRDVRPHVREMDEQAKLSKDVIRGLFDLGVMGIEVPDAHGGGGATFFHAVLAVEALSRVDPSVGVFVDVQNTLCVNAIMRWGNDEQKGRFLAALAAHTVGAYTLSEAGSGSDAFALVTRAREDAGDFVLTGRKLWITNANEADLFVVFATVNPEAGYRGITAFLVDRGCAGFIVGKKEDKLGIRASSTCELLFDECRVPRANVLGEVGKGYKVAIETLNEGRIGIGAQMIGAAQGALDHAVRYVRERKQFGRPIAEFQAVQHQIARAATELEAARLLVYHAARLRDSRQPFLTEAAMCKVFASEVAERVTSLAINLFGGNGFVKDYPVEKLWRDAKIGQIYEGTSNLQLQTIAKQLLGWSMAFTTISGRPIKPLYTPDDVAGLSVDEPGEYPYTRGIHRSGYRGKLWTMRQFAGFGTPEETNGRYKALLAAGGTGLSVAFDLPTLMGRDPDHELSRGEVGKCGVSVASLADMETLFEGIALGDITTSMTINSPAAMIFAMYLVVAEQHGVGWRTLSGTLQNDILKEFIAQKEYIYPPRPSMRLITDIFAFCAKDVPKWNTISVSGYHIREAGATAAQELAFTLRDGIEYVQWGVDAGLDVDEFVPRISFFFNAHSDFFEEIAKYRAARRIWAEVMRNRFGARNDQSWKLRFHAQTAGVSLTAQQPYNNVVRTALQALSAVLGGANSLHTNSLDEALGLPTEAAATLALRTQQILAYESGVANVVDPFGGSYCVEALTAEMEAEARRYFDAIDRLGGMVEAIEHGYPQREIARSSYEYQQAVERREKIVVGVNGFVDEREPPVGTLYIDETAGDTQLAKLDRLKSRRDSARVASALAALERAAVGPQNLMPFILEAVRAYATVGEMCDALRTVWGEYEEVPII